MIVVGIDPGKDGGIAWRWHDVRDAVRMPSTPRDVLELLRKITHQADGSSVCCFIEKVHSMPGQGVRSVFTFGHGLGCLEMAATAVGMRIEWVTPQKWQRALQCLTKGDKNTSKRRAQELFPELKVTHAIADALLISEYGWRVVGSGYGDGLGS